MNVAQYWSHTFLPDLIRQDGVAFDFGVNYGGFTRLVAGRCRRVVGLEPDPTWHDLWVGRIALPVNVLLLPKALAARPGKLKFNVNSQTCSSLHFAGSDTTVVEVEAVTLAEVLALEPEGCIDLIKMDIEGEELAVLREAPEELFSRVAQMTIEFHDFSDPSSVPAIREVIARMRRLGFHPIKFSWNSYGDMLFINQKLHPLSIWQKASLRLFHKYGRGIGRILGRLFKKASHG